MGLARCIISSPGMQAWGSHSCSASQLPGFGRGAYAGRDETSSPNKRQRVGSCGQTSSIEIRLGLRNAPFHDAAARPLLSPGWAGSGGSHSMPPSTAAARDTSPHEAITAPKPLVTRSVGGGVGGQSRAAAGLAPQLALSGGAAPPPRLAWTGGSQQQQQQQWRADQEFSPPASLGGGWQVGVCGPVAAASCPSHFLMYRQCESISTRGPALCAAALSTLSAGSCVAAFASMQRPAGAVADRRTAVLQRTAEAAIRMNAIQGWKPAWTPDSCPIRKHQGKVRACGGRHLKRAVAWPCLLSAPCVVCDAPPPPAPLVCSVRCSGC
jgi:hypothetical protein